MTFILELMGGLHGNKIFEIEGNFNYENGKKNFHFPRVVFVILDFKEGRTRHFQK